MIYVFLPRMVASMVYYGLSLNAGDLSGNIYLNFVLMAAAELASFLFCLFIMDITGRKLLHCSSMVVGGVACVATMFPVMYGNSGTFLYLYRDSGRNLYRKKGWGGGGRGEQLVPLPTNLFLFQYG